MAEFLLPVCLFFMISALYFGGIVEVRGATTGRQVTGLVAVFVVYLVLWWALRMVLGSFLPHAAVLVVSSVLSLLALPLLSTRAYRGLGGRLVRTGPPADADGGPHGMHDLHGQPLGSFAES
jgi:hypothetical protein